MLVNEVSSAIILAVLVTPEFCQDVKRITNATFGLLGDERIETCDQVRLAGKLLDNKTVPLVLNALHGCRRADVELEKNAAVLIADLHMRPNVAIQRIFRLPLEELRCVEIQTRDFEMVIRHG